MGTSLPRKCTLALIDTRAPIQGAQHPCKHPSSCQTPIEMSQHRFARLQPREYNNRSVRRTRRNPSHSSKTFNHSMLGPWHSGKVIFSHPIEQDNRARPRESWTPTNPPLSPVVTVPGLVIVRCKSCTSLATVVRGRSSTKTQASTIYHTGVPPRTLGRGLR